MVWESARGVKGGANEHGLMGGVARLGQTIVSGFCLIIPMVVCFDEKGWGWERGEMKARQAATLERRPLSTIMYYEYAVALTP